MPQLNVYVDEELALSLRREAREKGKSLSALVVEKLKGDSTESACQHWDAVFEKLRMLPAGDLEEPEELPWDRKDLRFDDSTS